MTDWIYVGKASYFGINDAVDLSFELSKQVILIDLDSPQKKPTWNKAGNILQVIDIDVVNTLAEISDSYSYLGFSPTVIKFQIQSGNNYRLRFKPVPWLTNFSISVWEMI